MNFLTRYKILFNNLNLTGVYNYDCTKIEITFTPNLPKYLSKSIEVFNALNA
ncbi:phage portal protein, partial [Staphylococcus devriesei]